MILKVPIYVELDVKFQEFNAEIVKHLSREFTKVLRARSARWKLRGSKEEGIPTLTKEPVTITLLLRSEVIEKMRKGD